MNISRFYPVIFCLLSAACSEAPSSETAATATSAPADAVTSAPEEKATYRILEATKNESISKLNVDVLLSKKVDEAQLKELGQHIKDSIGGYQKSYLFFYLDGMKVGSGAWATTHFTPEEEVQLLGATQAQEDSSKSKLQLDGKVIGKWYEEQRSASALAFYEKDGKCFLTRVYKGGTPSTTRFILKGNVFKPKEETGLGEYFVLQDDGTLGFVNEEGKVFGQAFPF